MLCDAQSRHGQECPKSVIFGVQYSLLTHADGPLAHSICGYFESLWAEMVLCVAIGVLFAFALRVTVESSEWTVLRGG